MSHLALKQLIGAALVDRELSEGLVNGRRSALLADFDLTDEERAVVACSESESVQDLASKVHSWLKRHGSAVSPRVEHHASPVL